MRVKASFSDPWNFVTTNGGVRFAELDFKIDGARLEASLETPVIVEGRKVARVICRLRHKDTSWASLMAPGAFVPCNYCLLDSEHPLVNGSRFFAIGAIHNDVAAERS